MNKKEKDRKYYLKNKDKVKARSKKYREEHSEYYAEYLKKYQEEHKEEIRIRRKKYRDKKENKEAQKKYQLIYSLENKERTKERSKKWREKNKEELKISKKKYAEDHKSEISVKQKKYREEHKEELSGKTKEYYKKNTARVKANSKKRYEEKKDEIKIWQKGYKGRRNKIRRHRYENDPIYKLNNNLSGLVNYSLKKNGLSKRGRHWEDLVGYTKEKLKDHLESLFTEGMNWDNHGKNGWEIDHIIPRSFFKYTSTDDVEFKMCWRLENLQPLWAEDNLSKSNKIVFI